MKIHVVQLCKFGIVACMLTILQCCSQDETPQTQSDQPLTDTIDQPQTNQPTNPLLTGEDTAAEEVTTDPTARFSNRTPPEDDRWITFGSFRAPRPASWVWIQPKSAFVTTNYNIPGAERNDFASFTITAYKAGDGVTLETNIQRWKSLFRTNGGAPVLPKLKTLQIHGNEATMVEIRGDYMGFSAAMHLHDQTLLVVVVEEETEMFFFKMLGPTITINAHRDELLSLLEAMEESLPTI